MEEQATTIATEPAPAVRQRKRKTAEWNKSTLWTARKARAVYSVSVQKRGFRVWWKTFVQPGMDVRSPKLKKITATMFARAAKRGV